MYYPVTGGIVEIDEVDLPLISSFNWHINCGYVKTNITIGKYKQKVIRLHRLIMDAPVGIEVDHVDGNTLNNRRFNLRLVNRRENSRNRHDEMSSIYPCVSWAKHANKFRLRIWNGTKHVHYGYFKTEQEALKMMEMVEDG